MRSQIDFDGRSIVALDLAHWVRIHGVDVVVSIVHYDNLGVPGLSSRYCISPNILRRDFAVFWLEMTSEAGQVIFVGFPNHSWGFGVGFTEFPVGIVIDIQLSV